MGSVVIHLASPGWSSSDSFSGRFSQRGTILQGAELLTAADNKEAFSEQLRGMNGFYAVIKQAPNLLMAAVDHIRSIPLFYGLKDGQLFLADDAEWVRRKVEDREMDALAREEFLLAGYVTGRGTLFPNVKQLQAGECLIAETDELGNISLSCERYYRFVHKEPVEFRYNNLLENIDSAAMNSVQRLIEYANGRQILVPLSGGYDSRLIASLLKRAGYTNVLCFSYGVAGNKEAEYSKKIALSLDFEWCFAEYTNECWAAEWTTAAAEEYRVHASNHASLPHIQDWLAVKKLVESDAIDSDAVVAPGHCCVTGYIPKDILNGKFGKKEYVRNIVKTHFSGRPLQCGVLLSEKVLINRLLSCEIDFNDKGEVASGIMEFNWSERQAKYITNSVRAYEQFGFDWWLPLWDTEFVNAWMNFPLRLRLERVFYIDYVSNVYSSVVPDAKDRVSGNSADNGRFFNWSRSVAKTLLPDFVVNVAKKESHSKRYKSHFLGFGGLMRADELDDYIKSGYTIIGAYSSLFIEGRWGKNEDSN